MIRRLITVTACLLIVSGLFASDLIDEADALFDSDQHREGYEFLKDAVDRAGSDSERAELLWRLSRVTMEVGDIEEAEGVSAGDLLARFEEAEGYADRAIELDPDMYQAYYWKSANMGRWGEIKGILNSLFKAGPMRDLLETTITLYPDHAASYYVLGIMYRKVPGRPISFGNGIYAVSFSRKSIDANLAEIESGVEDEVKLSHYLELARNLQARDWKENKRRKEHEDMVRRYRDADTLFEEAQYYEGAIDIPAMSDLEEAIEVIEWTISEYEKLPSPTRSQLADLEEARADLASWTR